MMRDMKPTCPTCNCQMSSTNGSMFLCAGCRELVQFFDVRPIDHSLPWWDKYVERPTKHQTYAWFQCRGQKQTPVG
jgi:tRNA(Ile2) C34 agmatinyltransferase TiaS